MHRRGRRRYGDLLPWFLVYGLGGGLLVPLTTAMLGALPAGRAGVASGVLNVSREVFGLLGITILGAILSARQTSLVADGAKPLTAFLEAYQSTLVIAAAIVLVGVPLSLFALRDPAAGGPGDDRRRAPRRTGGVVRTLWVPAWPGMNDACQDDEPFTRIS